jgi:hypothetical protein
MASKEKGKRRERIASTQRVKIIAKIAKRKETI